MGTTYEELLCDAEKAGVEVIEADLYTSKKCGRCINNLILINSNTSTKEKKEILAEELSHYMKNCGDILDQTITSNIKQENIARRESYKMLVEPVDLIEGMKHGATNIFEMADFLDITVETLNDILSDFKKQYGIGIQVGNYYLQLEPTFGILKDFGLFDYKRR